MGYERNFNLLNCKFKVLFFSTLVASIAGNFTILADFNPVSENDNLEFDNISVLNKIADNIDYSKIRGLNNTVITIKNS